MTKFVCASCVTGWGQQLRVQQSWGVQRAESLAGPPGMQRYGHFRWCCFPFFCVQVEDLEKESRDFIAVKRHHDRSNSYKGKLLIRWLTNPFRGSVHYHRGQEHDSMQADVVLEK